MVSCTCMRGMPQTMAVVQLLALLHVESVISSRGLDTAERQVQCSSRDGECAACLKTNDTRPDWASPCVFLSGKVEAGHTCAPAKWWYPPYNSAAKYPTVHACRNCSDCKPIPPSPPPPPCSLAHRPNCWSGTWHEAPKVVPSPKSVDGPLLGNGDVGVVLGASVQGNLTLTYYVSKNDFWFFQNDNIPGRPDDAASYIMGIGGIDLDFPPGTKLIQLTQNISAGSITAVASLSASTNVTADTFLSLEGHLVTTLSSTGDSTGHRIISTTWTFGGAGPTTGTSGHDPAGASWATRTTKSTVRPVQAALATVIASSTSGAKRSTTVLSGHNEAAHPTVAPAQQLTITAAAPITIATAVVSSLDSGSIASTLPTALANAKVTHGGRKLQSLRKEVEQWWSNYWNASSITLPTQPQCVISCLQPTTYSSESPSKRRRYVSVLGHDTMIVKSLEEFWFKSLYILGACSRNGKLAPGLWGAWVTTDSPAWHGDYTLNYNFQAPYFGVFSANHIDLLAPYWGTITDMVPQGKKDAASYNCSGVHLPGHIAPFGQVNHGDMGQHTDAIFAAMHFVNHWRHTHNKDFFREVSFPYLKLVAEWWTCWLQQSTTANGTKVYNDEPDCTREGCATGPSPNKNPAIAVTFIKFLFSHLVETASLSGISPAVLSQWTDIRDHIAAAPIGLFDSARTGRGSNTAPTCAPSHNSNCTTVLLPQEWPYYWKVGDNPLQLYAIYPGESIGIHSGPMQTIAANTVVQLNAWKQMNGFPVVFPAAVRAGVNFSLVNSQLRARIVGEMPPNGYLSQGGGGIETAGGLLAVTEMLLQSWDGVLRLFPHWSGEDASFTKLRSVGAFLVSAAISNKSIHDIEIWSEVGEVCRLQSPWVGSPVTVRDGGGVAVNVTKIASSPDVLMFATKVGESYTVDGANAT